MDLQHTEGLVVIERRGNRRKGNGRRKGGAALRDNGTIEREHRILTLLVKGHSQRAIALEMGMSPAGVSMLVKRALEARAKALEPYIEQARTLLVERYERLLERWWPMATGDWVDPENPETEGNPPSAQALDRVLKILDAIAEITGAKRFAPVPAPDPSGSGIHVHIHTQAERQDLQQSVLLQLRKVREKETAVAGELARVGTTQAELTGDSSEDKPGPPPRTRDAA
jgi:hypothetical protein